LAFAPTHCKQTTGRAGQQTTDNSTVSLFPASVD
jgi:hypothetical protein